MKSEFEMKVWHRGYADWAWKVRQRSATEIKAGHASSRTKARSAALDAVEQIKREQRAAWKPVNR